MSLMELERIGAKYRVDKLDHGYLSHYFARLEPRRFDPLIILEIGTYEGNSVKMWRDYFPFATICGIDSYQECMVENEDRITTFLGSQNDRDFLTKVANQIGPLDFVLDDASHNGAYQIVSWEILWKSVKSGCWYVIEDACTLFNLQWTGANDRTMLDVIYEKRKDILCGNSDIREVDYIVDGPNNAMIWLRKR